eukprot:7010262-Lingulodinium_polyedra.AAC.1
MADCRTLLRTPRPALRQDLRTPAIPRKILGHDPLARDVDQAQQRAFTCARMKMWLLTFRPARQPPTWKNPVFITGKLCDFPREQIAPS